MDCRIRWMTVTSGEWAGLLERCPHSTLLQSYYYAQTMREVSQQSTRHGLITLNGEEAGLFQMHEVSLFSGMIHGLCVDRGPLWFEGYGKPSHFNAFANTLNWKYPSRWGRKRRLLPEIYQNKHLILFNNWTKSKSKTGYQTFLLDISPDLEQIRQKLKKNWRYALKKAENEKIHIEKDTDLSTLGTLLDNYTRDRMERRYAGTSAKFLASLCKFATLQNECFILNAIEDYETIASILIFTHGRGATYQLGWTTPYGRMKNANNLLLWEAIKILKDRDITELDLGGFNDGTKGIKDFKEGLNGLPIALIGSYS